MKHLKLSALALLMIIGLMISLEVKSQTVYHVYYYEISENNKITSKGKVESRLKFYDSDNKMTLEISGNHDDINKITDKTSIPKDNITIYEIDKERNGNILMRHIEINHFYKIITIKNWSDIIDGIDNTIILYYK